MQIFPMNNTEPPFGVAKRRIRKGERVEILLTPNGYFWSDAIEFFDPLTQRIVNERYRSGERN